MTKRSGLDYLYVVWQDMESRNQFVIGTLIRNGHYEFSYGEECRQAQEYGFGPLVSFPDLQKTYQEDTLFPAFACRLPDPRRRDIQEILKKYGMTEYDGFELLKRSGARLPTDTISFVEPVFDEDPLVDRDFFVAGVRHYLPCAGKNCSTVSLLAAGTELGLLCEPANPHDPNAIQLLAPDGVRIGYLPRCYSKTISKRLNAGVAYRCRVLAHDPERHCAECLKVRLQMPPQQED